MHGMLSATVMLAAFAAIALVSGASAVWLFRAAAAAAGRSRPARPARPPGAATGQDPGAAGTVGTVGTAGGAGTVGVQGEPADEADGTETDYPKRTWLGAALTATAQPAGPAEHNGWTGPGDAAEPPGAGDVYDVDNWPGTEDSGDGRGGPDGPGCRSPGLRGWPDTAKSLYSRGWPVMDSPPHGPDAERPGNGTDTGADTGVAGEPDAAPEEVAGAEPSVRPEGARVYVLGESRRPGR